MRVRAVWAIALFAAGQWACSGGSNAAVELARLELFPAEVMVLERGEFPLEVRAIDAAGQPYQKPLKLAWSTEDPTVAEVSDDGVVRGKAVGETKVIAQSGRVRAEARVRVGRAAATKMVIEGAPGVMKRGEVAHLNVRISGRKSLPPETRPVWSVSDSAVLAIHEREVGVDVVAVGPGKAIVRAAIGTLGAEAEIRVVPMAGSMEVSPADSRVFVGQTVHLVAIIRDHDGNPVVAPAQWSHQPKDALVSLEPAGTPSADRRYTVLRPGRIEVRATFENLEAKATIDAETVGPFVSLENWRWGLCGLAESGSVDCFGDRPSGEPEVRELTPYRLETPEPLVSLSVGASHICGLTKEGRAYCMGGNERGALGTGDLSPRDAFSPVNTELRFREIHAGADYTCAISTEPEGDNAYCWGEGYAGKLGTGNEENQVVPTPILGHRFQTLAVSRSEGNGASATCGIDVEGKVLCWGSNATGQLGDGTLVASYIPVEVASEGPHVAVAVASQAWSLWDFESGRWGHACALTVSGEIRCWGNNLAGQVQPPGSMDPVTTPVTVAVEPFVSVLAFGHEYFGVSCGMESGGWVRCWGSPEHGGLFGEFVHAHGLPGTPAPSVPITPVGGGLRFRALDVWTERTCGVDLDGRAYCWGVLPDPSTGSGYRMHDEPVCLVGQEC